MSVLQGKRCYLSGPIEHSTNDDWRDIPIKVLVEEFGVDLLDPFSDPKQQWAKILNAAREEGIAGGLDAIIPEVDKTLEGIAHKFVRKDLTWVSHSDFLIAYLPKGIATTGTHHEIIDSVDNKNPTLLVCPEGRYNVPFWYWGFNTKRFGSWDGLFKYLREVENYQHKDDDRWSYVYDLL